MDRAFVYDGNKRPGVRLGSVCSSLGCKARKDGSFCYSEARTGREDVTVPSPFKCLNEAARVDKLPLDDHKPEGQAARFGHQPCM
jgi:hypothetical protein